MDLVDVGFAVSPVLSIPLIDFQPGLAFFRLRDVLVAGLDEPDDILKEEDLLF